MKKALVIAAALTLALVGCGTTTEDSKTETKEEKATVGAAETEQTEEEQTGTTFKWMDVNSADEAAKGAGFDKFGTFDSITIGDLEYKDPTFSYTGGVAQANYETPATSLYVRKASGAHTAPLTDRDETEFAQKWTETYEGLEVILCGAAKGAATVISWKDGTDEYKVTYQGLGGEEMTMNSDVVTELVKKIKEANGGTTTAPATTTETQPTTEQTTTDTDETQTTQDEADAAADSGEYTVTDVEAVTAAETLSGGEAYEWYMVTSEKYGDCWQVSTQDENGNTFTYYVDKNGEPHLLDEATGDVADATTPASTDEATETATDNSDYISYEDAKSAAVSSLGLGIPDNVSGNLVEGGDAPHYTITLTYGTEAHEVEVDAITGEVWG